MTKDPSSQQSLKSCIISFRHFHYSNKHLSIMSSLQVPNFLDRELFPELDDPPVNPAYLHMVAPMIGGEDSVYRLQINGEVFWQWRKFNGNASRIFCSLQISVQKLGYQLSSSSKNRLGKCLAAKTLAFLKALNNKTNGKLRQDFKTNTWKITWNKPRRYPVRAKGIHWEKRRLHGKSAWGKPTTEMQVLGALRCNAGTPERKKRTPKQGEANRRRWQKAATTPAFRLKVTDN